MKKNIVYRTVPILLILAIVYFYSQSVLSEAFELYPLNNYSKRYLLNWVIFYGFILLLEAILRFNSLKKALIYFNVILGNFLIFFSIIIQNIFMIS